MIPLLLWACVQEPLQIEVREDDGDVEVRANAPIDRVEVLNFADVVLIGRTLPVPTSEVTLQAPIDLGRAYVVRAFVGRRTVETRYEPPPREPLRVAIAAPIGDAPRVIPQMTRLFVGEPVPVTLLGDGPYEGAVLLEAHERGTVIVSVGDAGGQMVRLPSDDARAVLTFPIEGSTRVSVSSPHATLHVADLQVERLTMEDARKRLAVEAIAFPADGLGRPDRSRPADRIALPAPWWTALLRRFELGWRPRDDQAPWTYQSVTLRNTGDTPFSVAVSARVDDEFGPVAAFRSRVRGAETPTGAVSALLRVPEHGVATATLPVFVEERTVEEGLYTRVIEVTPLGTSEPLHRVEAPLVVTRGSSWASGGFLAALTASLLGLGLLVRKGPRWTAALDTPDLVTIALFGSLTFVVAAAARLVGYGVSAVLGPFAPLLTGLVDDAFRTCLLAALVSLVPRPGVVTLASLVGYLMRGLALGSFHPADLLYFGSIVLFLEGCLWVAGLTRVPTWVDESPIRRWLRLSLGFGVANALAVASGLVVTVVLYRLFLADWYVAMMVGLHGFLYVVVGCAFAVPFADRVRKVAS